MPKIILCTLAWSPELQRYALFDRETLLDIVPESRDWFEWLNQTTSFSFIADRERYTLRKEKRQRGDAYWYAYRGVGKQVKKRYVGKTCDLTPTHLEMSILGQVSSHLSSQVDRDSNASKAQQDYSSAKIAGTTLKATNPLLVPKLYIPRLPAKLISRARLLHLLEQQANGPLTLISAQAGAGKTTLLVDWIERRQREVAWVSLEGNDNQSMTRFLAYVIVALHKLDSQIGVTSLPPLKSPQPPALETILALLTNEIAASSVQPLTLVLDDYHLITTDAIHNAVAFLLDHLASHLHLIILTRSDPPLPLSRLRVRGQLLELRIDDLRFDDQEVGQFLHVMTDRMFSAEEVRMLSDRTEGWIAGLQLAALSLRRQHDVPAFVRDFTGSSRFVLDYLSEEVLSHLPPSTLTFLLRTCILERLFAPLCSALLDRELKLSEQESQRMLESLERNNLFVSALDDGQHSYRYHALFASVLQAHLSRSDPGCIRLLHLRASLWLEEQGFLHEAMHHALAIQNVARVCSLLEKHVWDMFMRGEFDTVLAWLDRLPSELEYTQPALCFYHATALACLGQTSQAEIYLAQGDQVEGAGASSVVISPEEKAALRASIVVARSDVAQALEALEQARANLPPQYVFLHGMMLGSQAIMVAMNGDFRRVSLLLLEARNTHPQIDNPFILQRGLLGMIIALTHLGQRSQVVALCEYGMSLTATTNGATLPFTGSLAIFLGIACYEENNLEAAKYWTRRGIELCERLGEVSFLPTAYALLAQTLYLDQAKSENIIAPSQEVVRLMHRAEDLLWQQPPLLLWSRQHAAYFLVRLWVVQRNVEALAHLEQIYPVDGAIGATVGSSYTAQTETWGLAYIRFGQHRSEETVAWLHWPIDAAEQAGRVLALMRMLILQALAYQDMGQLAKAINNVKRALLHAEKGGYVAMFLEMGRPIVSLLQPLLEPAEALPEGSRLFVRDLLRELGVQLEIEETLPARGVRGTEIPVPGTLEHLTEREREILELIGAGLSNQAIARKMVVEVSTIKWHVRHIYEKLHVSNRTQALLQAQAHGLLSAQRSSN